MLSTSRLILITVLLACSVVLAGIATWLRDLDWLYACVPFLVLAYLATFRREELRSKPGVEAGEELRRSGPQR